MSKRLLLCFLWVMLMVQMAASQTICSSQRYQDSIFHRADTLSGIYFASAIPGGIGAQPQDLYLDLYQPAGDTLKARPLIIFQFGGAFLFGSRTEAPIPDYGTYFAKCGYVVAAIDYRIGFDPLDSSSAVRAVYRAVQDLRASVRFLCQNAGLYGIDTNSIFLTGTSAGCISGLCSTFMTAADWSPAIHGTFLEPDDLGGLDSSGNNDNGNRTKATRGIISHWGAIFDTSYIVPGDSTPVLGIQGTADDIVPYIYGYPFGYPLFPAMYGDSTVHQRMSNLGLKNKWVPLVGLAHEPEWTVPAVYDTMHNEGRQFLWNIIKPVSPPVNGDTLICKLQAANYWINPAYGSLYCWQLTGNGTIVSYQNNGITVIWNDTGTVSVTSTELNYMDAQADPVSFVTHVIAPASASFNYGANQLHVVFTNTSQYATTYNWSFGNGDTSSAFVPVEVYTSPGTYAVTLAVGNGVCADTFSRSITIDTCPVAHFTYQLTNLNGIFYGDTTNTATYDWNFGDGDSANVNANHVFHQYTHTGTYAVVLQVQNQFGCFSSDTAVIQVVNSGINNLSENNASVVCNLSTGCQLKFSQPGSWTVDVYDLLGRKLTAQQIVGDYLMPVADFQSGVYLLKLYNGNQSVVTRFVKQ